MATARIDAAAWTLVVALKSGNTLTYPLPPFRDLSASSISGVSSGVMTVRFANGMLLRVLLDDDESVAPVLRWGVDWDNASAFSPMISSKLTASRAKKKQRIAQFQLSESVFARFTCSSALPEWSLSAAKDKLLFCGDIVVWKFPCAVERITPLGKYCLVVMPQGLHQLFIRAKSDPDERQNVMITLYVCSVHNKHWTCPL